MGDGFIVRRGGGKLEFFTALIKVTYPEGSVCTCSNGSKTLKAKGTSGKYLFNVEPGTWTVSCTDGTDTASQSVEITSALQTASVTLEYGFYLFKSGVGEIITLTYSKETNASYTKTENEITISYTGSDTCFVAIRNKTKADVDLTNYSAFKIRAKVSSRLSISGVNYGLRMCVASSTFSATSDGSNFVAEQILSTSSTAKEYSLDISEVSGTKYIGLWGASNATIYDMWLE